MLHFNKEFARVAANRQAIKWEPFAMQELRGMTAGFVGFGSVAQATAGLAELDKTLEAISKLISVTFVTKIASPPPPQLPVDKYKCKYNLY